MTGKTSVNIDCEIRCSAFYVSYDIIIHNMTFSKYTLEEFEMICDEPRWGDVY